MKFSFSARVGLYVVLLGVLCEAAIPWLERLRDPYAEPSVPSGVAMMIAYGVALIIRPSVAQFWERDDLFERATRPGSISGATRQLDVESGGFFGHLPSKLSRQVPPEHHCLRLPAFGVLYSTVFIFVIPIMATWVMADLLPGPAEGLRTYLAGPPGMVQPWMEPAYEKLVVKVTFRPEWFLGLKRITKAEANRIWRMPENRRWHEVRAVDRLAWYLNSKPMSQAALQSALREALSKRGARFVYLDLPQDAPFRVAVEAIEAVEQTPGTKVVLVTNGDLAGGSP